MCSSDLLKLSQAFSYADDVLTKAAKGIAEIITVHGYINVDFADVETVMTNSGVAMMGTGEAAGEGRALKAVESAVTSPLLNSNDVTGAKSILLNIRSGKDEISMDEVGEITDYINSVASDQVLIIWGTGFDESLEDKISVTVIATGFEAHSIPELYAVRRSKETVYLDENHTLSPETPGEFEVHDKKLGTYRLDEYDKRQRTIDFSEVDNTNENSDSENNKADVSVDEPKSRERIRKLKKHQNYLKDQGYLETDQKNEIEELENEPAYVRKNVKIDKPKYSASKKVSKYSLYEDEEKETHLSSNNSYLNDNVD